jgi:NAD(P)H dehydrogenase (quinone)
LPKIAIVYHSDGGHTQLMAEAVHEGARSVEGVQAALHRIDRKAIVEGRYQNDALLDELDGATPSCSAAPPTWVTSPDP